MTEEGKKVGGVTDRHENWVRGELERERRGRKSRRNDKLEEDEEEGENSRKKERGR